VVEGTVAKKMILLGSDSRSCHSESEEYLLSEAGAISEKMVSDNDRIAETWEAGEVESKE
jgi:hypothetical protein